MNQPDRNRHDLIEQMEWRYLQRAWSDMEMADELDTDRTNIYKIRVNVMEARMQIPFIEEGRGKWRIDKTNYVPNIRLNPEEALALYLGGRRLQQQTKTGQTAVATALQKLAHALRKPLAEKLVQAADVILNQEQDKQQTHVFQLLMKSWLNGRRVRIKHRKPHGELRTYTVSPYQLEPSIWGDGVYLIGGSDYHNNNLATFKLSRIEEISETSEPFTVPDNFDSHTLLQHAWGIWHADEKPVVVRLKFSQYVTPRVKESIWHPSQTIQDLPEGGCIWQAEIAEWREMVPWVRGWGSDVEVLEPEELREEMKIHVQKSTRLYKLAPQTADSTTRLLRLWGKTTKNTELFHPAFYHMLDVAHIAQQLLSPRASIRWRQVLAHALAANADSLYEWLPYLIALHDIGKLSVPFQLLNTKQVERLEQEGVSFGQAQKGDAKELHHTIVGRLVADEITNDWPPHLKTAFLDMVSGHHGVYQAESPNHQRKMGMIQEPAEWNGMRQYAVQLLQSYLLQQWPEPLPEPANVSAAIVALNGFCILCDWLGSDESYFKAKPTMPLADYVLHSRQQAYQRVKDAGFFQTAVSHAPTTFTQLFNTFPPRPLQTEIDHIPTELLRHPTLTIIEAPTGEGKTEAALALARRIAALRGTDELYIALPTTATSNAMYERVQEHLTKRLGLPPQMVRLIHGQSFLEEDDLPVDPLTNGGNEEIPSLEWFAPKKVALLAPFGVGTIDQAELSALNVRHNALRMIGLAGKVVILDEVHAYDTYMTTIIKRMLTWLAALGSSVILLSATLPQTKRRELATAFASDASHEIASLEAYPSLLTIGKTVYTPANPIAVDPLNQKVIHLDTLHFTDEQPEEKARWLLDKIQTGGCVCWITNTVGRAQAIFESLGAIAPATVDLTLLHARFPLEDRQAIEDQIRKKYNKEGIRPTKGIVVGTQVLEQSLDLDFDIMVTDLAPIDLLLQRAGRLHRHKRDKTTRYRHVEPRLFINMEMGRADKGIYSEYILLKTKQVLDGCENYQIKLPWDYRPLIETVYDPTPPPRGTDLYQAWDALDKKAVKLEENADMRLTNEPDPDDPFYHSAKLQDFKEDEDSSAWAVAQTRWGQDSVTVIPLMKVGETAVSPLASNPTPLPINQKASRRDQLHLLKRSLRISAPQIVTQIKAQKDTPKLFADSALLKPCFPLWLKPSSEAEGVFVSESLNQTIQLHPILGLVFKQDQNNL